MRLQNLEINLTLQHLNMKKKWDVNTVLTKRREIHILDETRRNCLVELEGYEQAIQNIINSLYFNNEQQQIPSQNIPDLKYELYHSVRYITQFLYHSVFISVCSYY